MAEKKKLKRKAPAREAEPAAEASIPIPVVVDIVKNICLAFSDITLYAFTHPLAQKQVKQTWEHLRQTIVQHGRVTLSMADGKLFFEGVALEEKNPSVKKLSHHFEDLQVTSLTFTEAVTEPEITAFFEVFAKDRTAVEAEGGLEALFAKHEIKDVRLNSAVYRLIHEDEKVVAADTVTMDRQQVQTGVRIDNEIVRYFIEELLRRAENSEHLINRMKNDPVGLARQVDRILHYSDEQLEKVQFEDLMATMLRQIETAARAIAHSEGPSTDPAVQEEMARALSSVDGELQRRKQGIASSGAVRFVQRMTDLIAAYSDSALAESTMREFVEQEHSLENVQRMLQDISPDADVSRRLLEKIKHLMSDHQIDAERLVELLDARLRQGPDGPGPGTIARRRPRDYGPAVARLRMRVVRGLKELPDARRLAAYLEHLIAREARQRAPATGTTASGGRSLTITKLTELEQEVAGLRAQLEQLTTERDEAVALRQALEAEVLKRKDNIAKLKQACVELRTQRDTVEAELKNEVENEKRRQAELEKQFEEQLEDEVGTAMGMVNESEDVRVRLERIIDTLRVGVIVIDREGRVVSAINADDIPYLQVAMLPPPELVEALSEFDRSSVIQCEDIDIFEVQKDAEGFVSAFLFMPHESRPESSRGEVLEEIFAEIESGTVESFDELAAEIMDEHPIVAPGKPQPTAIMERFEQLAGEIGSVGGTRAARPPRAMPSARTVPPRPEPPPSTVEQADPRRGPGPSRPVREETPPSWAAPVEPPARAAVSPTPTVPPKPSPASPARQEIPPPAPAPAVAEEPPARRTIRLPRPAAMPPPAPLPAEPEVPPEAPPEPEPPPPRRTLRLPNPNAQPAPPLPQEEPAAAKPAAPPWPRAGTTPTIKLPAPAKADAPGRSGITPSREKLEVPDDEPAPRPEEDRAVPHQDPNAELRPQIMLKKRKDMGTAKK